MEPGDAPALPQPGAGVVGYSAKLGEAADDEGKRY